MQFTNCKTVKDDREFRNNTSSLLLCDKYLTRVCKTSFTRIISRKVASYLAETVRKIIGLPSFVYKLTIITTIFDKDEND
jgi:hypothetical protein